MKKFKWEDRSSVSASELVCGHKFLVSICRAGKGFVMYLPDDNRAHVIEAQTLADAKKEAVKLAIKRAKATARYVAAAIKELERHK